jgi:gluconolactonase
VTANPIDGFSVSRDDLRFLGQGLQRPECILAEPDGTLWAADARGGVVRISPDDGQEVITQSASPDELTAANAASRLIDGTLPNGLAFDRNGDFLIANFGTDRLERMTRTGYTTPMLETLGGEPVGKTNFVCRDSKDRLWVTVSTKAHDWQKSLNPSVKDGQVLLYTEDAGARVVADGLVYPNECRVDADETHLYVVQSCGRNIVRFRIEDDGSLSGREIYGPADHGRIIDGIAFDAHGNLWGTYVFTDGIFAVTPDGDVRLLFEDSSPDEVARVNERFQAEALDVDFLLTTGGPVATWCTSVTFGGPDLRTVFVGTLRQSRIASFRAPVAGLPLIHWAEQKAGNGHEPWVD